MLMRMRDNVKNVLQALQQVLQQKPHIFYPPGRHPVCVVHYQGVMRTIEGVL